MIKTIGVNLLIVILALATIACSQIASTPQVKRDSTSQAKLASTSQTELRLSNDNWHLVLAEAKGAQKAYLGSDVDIRGKVAQVLATSDSESQFAIETNADISVGNRTLVGVGADPGLAEDQWVRVQGTLNSYWNTQNLLGAEIRLPVVTAKNVVTITRADAYPSIITVRVEQSITRHELTITLEKLEIADSEKRVYIHAINNSPNKASLYAFDAVLVQGTRQIKRKELFGEELEEPDTTLVSGTETQGILLFEPVSSDNSPVKLIWQGPRTDDYSASFDDWEWAISW